MQEARGSSRGKKQDAEAVQEARSKMQEAVQEARSKMQEGTVLSGVVVILVVVICRA